MTPTGVNHQTERTSPLDGMTVAGYDVYQDRLNSILTDDGHCTNLAYTRGCRCAGCRMTRKEYILHLKSARAARAKGRAKEEV